MKKQFILAASLATTALFFARCSTEDKQITPASSNTKAVSYAVFSSIDEYESLFTDPNTVDEKADKVAARFGTYSEKARVSAWGEQDTLYPEFLRKILNDDHIVQIDKWLIKVDLMAEQVLVLDVEYKEQYQDLVNSNLSNTKIQFFSTNDEVLELLKEGNGNTSARVNGLFCKDKNAPGKSIIEYKDDYGNNQNFNASTEFVRFKRSLCYFNGGLYFKLNYVIKLYALDKYGVEGFQLGGESYMIGADSWWAEKCESLKGK